jgi:signal-transduction protein with cAMP-binding, CBS, and nucleotidyltransferase domain
MQTDLIQNTRVFKEFERSFNHFFEECERGFTNEMIINMFCRIQNPGKTVISYKSNVKEMFFIRQGLVEVYNNENDEEVKDKPILYLPKYSYFGDYQILYNLKSNLLFKTLAQTPDEKKTGPNEVLPDIIFMCCSMEHLNEFCDLFPQTAENIRRRSLQRRKKFMEQKNTNSKRYKEE